MNYEEAKRKARKLLGENATVWEDKQMVMLFRFNVGIETPDGKLRVGVGSSWEEVFAEIQRRAKEEGAKSK